MRAAITIAVVMLLIVAASAVVAEPYVSVWQDQATGFQGTASWYGNVGLIVTPTAILPPATAATAQYHRIQREHTDVDVWGVNFGVTDWLEAGGTHVDLDPDLIGNDALFDVLDHSGQTIGNVKVGLDIAKWLCTPSLPALAIGSFDVTNEINRAFYVVMSKSFQLSGPCSPPINLHLGYANNDLGSGALSSVFGGIEFAAGRYGLVQAEYDSAEFNADFRFNISNHLSLDAGVLDGDFGYGATYRSQF